MSCQWCAKVLETMWQKPWPQNLRPARSYLRPKLWHILWSVPWWRFFPCRIKCCSLSMNLREVWTSQSNVWLCTWCWYRWNQRRLRMMATTTMKMTSRYLVLFCATFLHCSQLFFHIYRWILKIFLTIYNWVAVQYIYAFCAWYCYLCCCYFLHVRLSMAA